MKRLAPKTLIDGVVSGAMLLASLAVMLFVWQNREVEPVDPNLAALPTEPVSLLGTPLEGEIDSPLAIVVFSDFECPFCRSFAQSMLPSFRDEYISRGKVLVSFRHLPLRIHPAARPAAQAAVCAAEQGRFWAFHDTLFAEPVMLQNPDRAVRDVGGDASVFATCKGSERASKTVDSDVALARTLNIGATPTFLVGINDGGRAVRVTARFTGGVNYEKFKQRLGFSQDGPGR